MQLYSTSGLGYIRWQRGEGKETRVTGQHLGIARGQVLLHLFGRFTLLGICCCRRRRRRLIGLWMFEELQIDDGQSASLDHALLLQHLHGDDLVEAQLRQLLDAALRLLDARRERTETTACGKVGGKFRFTRVFAD